MSNKHYPNTAPFAHERNTNVNFNYVWDQSTEHWIPQTQSSINLDYILQNAKDFVHKFGSNPNISQNVSLTNPEAIWDGSSPYPFPSNTGASIEIVSTDNGDNQEIFIQGLDQNFDLQEATATLNGVTPVSVSGTWTRVFRSYNTGNTDIIGSVSIRDSVTTTQSYAQILDGNNQTLMSIYTIPADCTGYLIKYKASAFNPQSSSNIGYTLQLKTREFDKVFRVQSITSVGTNHESVHNFPFPLKLEPKTDVIFNVVSANGNNGAVNVDFDIALL